MPGGYCTGMSQPAKSTIRAPRRRWAWLRAVVSSCGIFCRQSMVDHRQGKVYAIASLMAVLFPRLSPRTYHTDVAQSIRAAIHDGRLTGGTPLVERRIAEDMGISRAPVREALRQLEEEGLVVNIPFKGWYVTEVSPQAMAEIVSLRQALESFAAERATSLAKPADLQALRRLFG